LQVVGTRTTVDVQWQDGSRAEAAPARGFLPVSFHDEHDFAAGDFVELRDPFADMDESPADGGSQPSQVSVWPAIWAGVRLPLELSAEHAHGDQVRGQQQQAMH
jgi:hypothetical protein